MVVQLQLRQQTQAVFFVTQVLRRNADMNARITWSILVGQKRRTWSPMRFGLDYGLNRTDGHFSQCQLLGFIQRQEQGVELGIAPIADFPGLLHVGQLL